MTRTIRIALGALFAGLLLPSAGRAQFEVPSGGSITGTGTAVVKRQPTILRMNLMLTAKGKTAEEAVAVLKARRQTATAELVKLGADKKSIQVSNLSVSAAENQRRRQVQMMIRQRMQAGGGAAKLPKLPEVVNVVAMLTAEWPITAKDPEELFLTVQQLQGKVKGAKLAGGKEAEKLSPEEEELAEEMKGEMGYYGGEEEFDPSTPMFSYVAKITEEDRTKAMAEAFQKAKADAQRIAAAAGVQLGPLAALSSDTVRHMYPGYPDYGPQMSPGYRPMMERLRMPDGRENAEDEAVASDPAQVGLSVSANASFRLGNARPAPTP
jgi:uncharacterized protein YggE